MNRTDITVWYRIYLPTGGSTDIMFEPLKYRTWDLFVDDFQSQVDSLGFVDYEIVDWDFLSQNEAYSINQDETVWRNYEQLFEVSKDYGVPAQVIVQAAADMGGYNDFKDFMENAYQGEEDSVLDYAYVLLDDIGIDEDLAERYFNFDSFGYALQANGDIYAMIMDDWEDRYDTEAEAQAIYDEMMRMSDTQVAEWYIYDVVGDIKSALGDQMSDYFDYKKFAKDLGYDGFEEIGGYIFRAY